MAVSQLKVKRAASVVSLRDDGRNALHDVMEAGDGEI